MLLRYFDANVRALTPPRPCPRTGPCRRTRPRRRSQTAFDRMWACCESSAGRAAGINLPAAMAPRESPR